IRRAAFLSQCYRSQATPWLSQPVNLLTIPVSVEVQQRRRQRRCTPLRHRPPSATRKLTSPARIPAGFRPRHHSRQQRPPPDTNIITRTTTVTTAETAAMKPSTRAMEAVAPTAERTTPLLLSRVMLTIILPSQRI
ncbi:unnamed protein product, partial [Sphacelaria rigidula]